MSMNDGCNGTVVALFSDAPYMGGAEHYLCLLAGGIERLGFEPVLVTSGRGKLGRLKDEMRRNGFGVHETNIDIGRNPSGARELLRIFRILDPAILHINLPGPFDAAYSLVAPLARLAGVRRIVTTEHLPMVPSFAKARILRGFSGRFVDRTIAVSKDNIDHLVRNHGVPVDRIRLVYNGIPDQVAAGTVDIRGELSLSEGAFLVACVGALESRKGQGTLLGAVGRLPDRAHLLLVGEGPEEGAYRERVSREGLGERIHFLGFRDDVSGIMRAIDMLAVPSTLEATPYVILEAMAAGLPVVANNLYGIPELVSDRVTGLLVEPGDESMLAAVISGIMEQPDLAERMGKAARERYEKLFTLERSALETVNVYRELLG